MRNIKRNYTIATFVLKIFSTFSQTEVLLENGKNTTVKWRQPRYLQPPTNNLCRGYTNKKVKEEEIKIGFSAKTTVDA